ncbi:MAG: MATE family efflux transporter [Clostridia bacterium]|nr:MATE family efflux transporter [Clostridia bacterium]
MQNQARGGGNFYRSLFRLVLPIAVQNLISTAVSSADVIMVGYVGQDALSSVSLANQIQFILTLVYSGIASGATMMAAQYWGKQDTKAIEKIMGIAMRFSVGISFSFFILAFFFPKYLMLIFTSDPVLIEGGISYLKVIGFSYLLMSISQVYLCIMRSIERVVFSMVTFGSALILNILLNAVFIFGLFGVPKMGIIGAATATVIARGIELFICLVDAARFKKVRLRISAVFEKNPVLFRDYLKYALPAFGNEVVWGVAFSMYSVIMGHLGSDMVAANSVVVVARNLGTVVCFGIANGGAIYLGKQIGDGRMEDTKRDASRLCKVTFVSGIAGGLLVLLVRPLMAMMVDLTPVASGYLTVMLFINVYYVLGQAMNTTVICGVFRSGGDSRFGFICDTIDMWCFSVPLGFICAFVFKLPPMWVYFVICLDEFVKMPFVYKHYKSYRWLKNITRENV